MNQNTPQTLKGFRDFLPKDMVVRNYVKNIFSTTLESFGYEPLETPTLEYASTLLGKYGDEADKLVYTFSDRGERQIGLRYDLTVPVSKVLSIYQNQIALPFKQYQIQLVWRADKPQKGRYREFIQVEADTFGATSPLSDAEYIAIMYQVLKNLNFKNFVIKVNNRPILYQILTNASITDNQNSALQTLDKFDKIGKDGVTKELENKGFSTLQIEAIFASLKSIKPDQYLEEVFECASSLGVPKDFYTFDPTLVRGLDYYTGPIFEAFILDNNIGSVCGGGRFDNLISQLGGPSLPATGIAFGFDRIIDCIESLNLLPDLPVTNIKVMVANFGKDSQSDTVAFATTLREKSINTLLYPSADKLGKQFKFASDKGIPFVAIIGTDEAKNKQVTFKNLLSGEQSLIDQSQSLEYLRSQDTQKK
jgi:histidyl-tRNA synthetase